MRRATLALSAEYAPAVTSRATRTVLAGFLLLVAGLVVAGGVFFGYERDRARTDEVDDLTSMADLLAQGVASRLDEWLSFADLVAKSPELDAGGADPAALPAASRRFLSEFARREGCRSIVLLGPGGAVLFDSRLEALALPDATRTLAREGRRGWSGAYTQPDGQVVIDAVAPLAAGAGAIVLRLDPALAFSPHHAGASHLAIRRVTGDTVVLGTAIPGRHNELELWIARAGSAAGGPERARSATTSWPVVVERPVPGTPWWVEARTDEADLAVEQRHWQSLVFAVVVAGITIAAGATTFALWSLRRALRRARARALADRRVLAQKYENLALYANDPVLILAPDGKVLECNQRAEEFFGLAGDHVVGTEAALLFGEGAREAVRCALASALQSGEARVRVTLDRADGARRALEARACRIEIGGEKELQFTLRDVTELEQAQATLLQRIESEACLARIAADFVRAPLSCFDEAVANALRSLSLLLGTDRIAIGSGQDGVIRGTTVLAAGDSDTHDQPVPRGRWWAEVVASGGAVLADVAAELPAHADVEREYYGRLGIRSLMVVPLGQFEGTSYALALGAHRPNAPFLAHEGLVRTAGEIIASALARRESVEKNRLLLRAIEQSPSSVVITNREGLIEYVNPAFVTVSGYSAEEVLGQNPRVLKSGQMRPEEYAELWQTISSGNVWRGEFVNRRKNGELYREAASLSGVIDSRGEISHYVGIKDDITARRKLEDDLRQSQKMEAVGRLAGGVAHDFNNILTAILGHCFLADALLDEASAVRASVVEIRRAAERAARLTQQLLAFSRKQIMQPARLDLNEVIDDMRPMLERLVPEHIEIVLRKGADLPSLLADPGQVEQVILNVVLNARDAMPAGGRVVVETARATLSDEEARAHGFAAAGSFVRLSIADDGVGMSGETLARCFEPFFTTKDPVRGTGLGLATVYGIVKQSGGEIAVHSEPGEGTRFDILLPGAPAGETVREVRSSVRAEGGSETILVVEDNLQVREMIRQTLTAEGYRVLEAARGEHALALVNAGTGRLDLLVTDVVMPGMSGRQLADHVTSLYRDTRVLYISGYAHDAELLGGLGLAEGDFLQKPFTPDALLSRVRRLLDRPVEANP